MLHLWRILFTIGLALCSLSAEASELGLTWNECPDGGGEALRLSNCNNLFSFETVIPSLVLAAAVDSVIGMEIVIDVVSEAASLPDWWRFEPGGCNAGSLSASADFSTLGSCSDPWTGNGIAVAQAWWVGQPRGGSNQARLLVASAVSSANDMARLEALVTYYAANIRIAHQRSLGAGSCSGCSTGACLVLNSIQLIRMPGAQPAEVQVLPSGGGQANWMKWQNNFAPCGLVPVRRTTWGAIKGLYR